MACEISPYPLQHVANETLQELAECLWEWQLCGNCRGISICVRTACPWSRAKKLRTFWDRYRKLTGAYVPEYFTNTPALSSHGDLLSIIRLITSHPNVAREQLIRQKFGQETGSANLPATSDSSRAINLAASILLLTNCGVPQERVDFLEDGNPSLPWQDHATTSDLVTAAFPPRTHHYFHSGTDEVQKKELLGKLTAKELKRDAKMQFEVTDDLRSHLDLDLERRVVRVFHDTAVLKEMLLASQFGAKTCVVPRSLALEVLDTIHNILFPSDRVSQALLSDLVFKHSFDKDLLHYESARYRRSDDPEVTYTYFGTRLAELYDELQNPTPRTKIEGWFEKKSGARYMLMATMIGVFIAVIIGIMGLGISGFQAWVSYQQWKHPGKSD